MKWRVLALCSLAFSLCHAYRVMLSVLLPTLQTTFGMNYALLSVLASAYDFGYSATLILGGFLAGRLGRKKAIWVGIALISATSFLSAAGGGNPFRLMAYRAIAGLGFSLYFPAGWSVLASLFPTEERGRAFGIHTSGSAIGRVYGPLLVGALIGLGDWRLPFWLFGFLSLAGALLLLWNLPGLDEPRPRMRVPLGRIFYFLSQKTFLVPCSLNILTFMYFSGVVNFYPLFLSRRLALSGAAISWLVSFISVVSLFSNPTIGHFSDKVGRTRMIPLSLAYGGLVMLALPWFGGGGSILLYSGLIGFSLTANVSLMLTYLTEVNPQFGEPLAIGVYNTIAVGGGLLGNILYGVVADFFGLNVVFLVMAFLLLAGSLGSAFLLRLPAASPRAAS